MSKERALKKLFETSMESGGFRSFHDNFEQSIGIHTDDGKQTYDPNKREIDYQDFELGRVCQSLLGNDWKSTFESAWVAASQAKDRMLYESTGTPVLPANIAYVSAALDVIAGLANARALERPARPEFIYDEMCTVTEASGEGGFDIIVRPAGDKPNADLADGQQLPTVTMKGSRVHRNRTKNQGCRVKVNLYTVLDDLTGTLYEAIDEQADLVLNERERKVADCLMGIGATDGTGITCTQDGMAFYPYQTSASTVPSPENQALIRNFVNQVSSSIGPNDYTAVEKAMKILLANVDPFTGLPVKLESDLKVLIPQAARMQWENILLADTIWNVGSIGLTTALSKNTVAPNPLKQFGIKPIWSQIWTNRQINVGYGGTKYTMAAADTYTTANSVMGTWYLGNPKKAIAYWQRQPYTVTSVPVGSAEYGEQTVLVQDFRERGEAYWKYPRAMFFGQA